MMKEEKRRDYDGKMVCCCDSIYARFRLPSVQFSPFCSISPKGHVWLCAAKGGATKGGEDEVRTDGVEVGCMEEQTERRRRGGVPWRDGWGCTGRGEAAWLRENGDCLLTGNLWW